MYLPPVIQAEANTMDNLCTEEHTSDVTMINQPADVIARLTTTIVEKKRTKSIRIEKE